MTVGFYVIELPVSRPFCNDYDEAQAAARELGQTAQQVCPAGVSARGAGAKQLRGSNEPWKRKFEGKSRLYEQKLHIRPDGWTRLRKVPKSDTSSRVHQVDADGAGGK